MELFRNYSINLILKNRIMKLEIKHLAAYLPYFLNVFSGDSNVKYLLTDVNLNKNTYQRFVKLDEGDSRYYQQHIEYCKPILRPLRDISTYKYKPRYGQNKYPISEIMPTEYVEIIECGNVKDIPQDWFELLVKHHFDVFYLINKKLAVDINSL